MADKVNACWNCGDVYTVDSRDGLNIELSKDKQCCRVWCDCGVSGPWAEDSEQAIIAWNKHADD